MRNCGSVVLNDLIQESKDGEWGKDSYFDNSIKMVVIRATDFEKVMKGSLEEIPQRFIKKQIADRKKLFERDIILETAGGGKDRPTGRTILLKKSFCDQTQMPITCASFCRFIRINAVKALPEYVFYKLQYLYNEGFMRQFHTQHTGVARFQYTIFATTYKFEIPSCSSQQKIASILSNYDDLIENNTRRIEILEQMAKLVYEEWFIKFRFSGHEKVKMISSELGEIPEGWKVEKLGDICHIVMGQSPKSEFYNETGEGLPFHQGVTNFGDRFPIDKIYCTVLNRIAEKGDILFSVRAPVGRINIANKKIVIGRGLCSIHSKTGNQAFMFQQLKNKFQIEDSMGGGTIFKSVTKNDMYEIKVIFPLPSLISKFEVTVQPIFQSLEILTLKNQNLRKTRDLLLPKLISGEIDVSDLDIRIRNEYQEHNFNFGEPQDEKGFRAKMV